MLYVACSLISKSVSAILQSVTHFVSNPSSADAVLMLVYCLPCLCPEQDFSHYLNIYFFQIPNFTICLMLEILAATCSTVLLASYMLHHILIFFLRLKKKLHLK